MDVGLNCGNKKHITTFQLKNQKGRSWYKLEASSQLILKMYCEDVDRTGSGFGVLMTLMGCQVP